MSKPANWFYYTHLCAIMAHRELSDFLRKHPRKTYGKYYDAESHLKIAKERNLL